jgi:hypothetical protein
LLILKNGGLHDINYVVVHLEKAPFSYNLMLKRFLSARVEALVFEVAFRVDSGNQLFCFLYSFLVSGAFELLGISCLCFFLLFFIAFFFFFWLGFLLYATSLVGF